MCDAFSDLSHNARLPMSQVNSFTPVCTTRCPLKLLLPEKPRPLVCTASDMVLQILSVTELPTTVNTSELLHSCMIHQVASQMIRRHETLSTVRTRVREDTTMCTFMKLIPMFGGKASMAEFALNAFQTCRNSTWHALFAIHRNTLQTKITICEYYDC